MVVRDLSHELHERIDMRQIGVREEAAIVGGFGHWRCRKMPGLAAKDRMKKRIMR